MISIKQSVYQINDLITKMTVTERACKGIYCTLAWKRNQSNNKK